MAKTGAHIALGPRSNYGQFCDSKPAVCIGVDDGGALLEVKQRSGGHTVTIFRDTSVYLEAPPGFNTADDMTALARAWYPALKAKWQQNPSDFYTITNEIGGGDGPDVPGNLTRLVAYEREIMRLANLDGFSVCILNHATGSPGDIEVWKQISAPFIVEAWAAGNIYGRHVYGEGDLVDSSGNVLQGGPIRPFRELDYLRSLGAAGGVALTEVGLDGGFGYPGEQRTVTQMAGYEQALRLADELIGLCWWTLGTHQSAANWQDALPAVAQYNLDNPTPAWEWPDGPDEPEEPMDNLLRNADFEGGWFDQPTGQVPNEWTFTFYTGDNPYDPDNYVKPETRVLPKSQLPPGEWEQFGLSGNQAVKVFKGGLPWHGDYTQHLEQPLTQNGRATIRFFADLVLSYGPKVYATYDPDNPAGQLRVNGGDWYLMRPGEINEPTFDLPAGTAQLKIEWRCNYPLPNSAIFFDDSRLEYIEDEPTMTWEEQLFAKAKKRQLVAFNHKAALQMKMIEHGLTPAETEFDDFNEGGEAIKAQLAINQITAEKRVYWVKVPELGQPWVGVEWYPDGGSNDTDPFEFKTYPVQGRPYTITSPFNAPRSYGQHEGIDLSAPMGWPVVAVADGVVDYVRTSDISGYGLYVRVKHNERFLTWYTHLQSVAVTVGEPVEAGDILGFADSTGNSTGSHLHLTLQDMEEGLDGYVVAKVVNPKPFLDAIPAADDIDLLPYLRGDGRLYEVKNANGGQERFQTQTGPGAIFYQTKNSAWEEMWANDYHIIRDTDTSPGGGRYYRMQMGDVFGATWIPRHWQPGGIFTRDAFVQFYNDQCQAVPENSGPVTDTMKFVAQHSAYTFRTGITLNDVIELLWSGGERYFYCRGFGLVGWEREHQDPSTPQWSAISEIHEPGTRPDNDRDVPDCMG